MRSQLRKLRVASANLNATWHCGSSTGSMRYGSSAISDASEAAPIKRSKWPSTRVSLHRRSRFAERFQLAAGGLDAADQRPARQVNFEPARAFHLRDQVHVGQRRRVAEAKFAAFFIGSQQCLNGVETVGDPGAAPAIDRCLVGGKVVAQSFQDAAVVDGVNVAAHHGRQRAHLGSRVAVCGQQGRRGVALVQPLDDGGRLDQNLTAVFSVELQRGQQALRVDGFVRSAQMLLGAKIDSYVLHRQAFEVERYAQPVRGAAAEEGVELHGAPYLKSNGNLFGPLRVMKLRQTCDDLNEVPHQFVDSGTHQDGCAAVFRPRLSIPTEHAHMRRRGAACGRACLSAWTQSAARFAALTAAMLCKVSSMRSAEDDALDLARLLSRRSTHGCIDTGCDMCNSHTVAVALTYQAARCQKLTAKLLAVLNNRLSPLTGKCWRLAACGLLIERGRAACAVSAGFVCSFCDKQLVVAGTKLLGPLPELRVIDSGFGTCSISMFVTA